jgi:apolipoprotein N-acyltransferase
MNFLIALLAGAASAFAFAPYSLWPLMPLAFAALCELIARAPSLRRALLIGWGFGVGQFCIGLNWIATAFTFQAAMPAWLGWVAVMLLSFYLAVYPTLAVGLAWRWGGESARHDRERRLALVLALAGAWAVCEWLRATMFTGFAWNPVGAILIDTGLLGASRLIGTYGLSLLTVLAGGALWLAYRGGRRTAMVPVAIIVVAALPSLSVASSEGLTGRKIRIVQPNIGQADKWREGFDAIAGARLAALSQRPFAKNAGPPSVVFWPEAAVTEPLSDERVAAAPYIDAERARAVRRSLPGTTLVTGGLGIISSDGQTVGGATNSVFILDRAARLTARYDKAHLVPYGEYLPMRPILSAIGLSRLAPGDLDFADGPGPRSIALPGGGLMGLQICYEIIFSGQVVDRAHRPSFLFNPSNDAWFGAWGPPQHLAQARLRAAEEGLPVIRSTPTGISALIDARGRLLQSIPAATAGIIDADLPAPAAPTLFAQVGNVIPLLLGFALLFAAIALARRGRYRNT